MPSIDRSWQETQSGGGTTQCRASQLWVCKEDPINCPPSYCPSKRHEVCCIWRYWELTWKYVLPTTWSAAVKCGGVSEEEGVLSATGHHVHTLINAIYGKYNQTIVILFICTWYFMCYCTIDQRDGTGCHAWDQWIAIYDGKQSAWHGIADGNYGMNHHDGNQSACMMESIGMTESIDVFCMMTQSNDMYCTDTDTVVSLF